MMKHNWFYVFNLSTQKTSTTCISMRTERKTSLLIFSIACAFLSCKFYFPFLRLSSEMHLWHCVHQGYSTCFSLNLLAVEITVALCDKIFLNDIISLLNFLSLVVGTFILHTDTTAQMLSKRIFLSSIMLIFILLTYICTLTVTENA